MCSTQAHCINFSLVGGGKFKWRLYIYIYENARHVWLDLHRAVILFPFLFHNVLSKQRKYALWFGFSPFLSVFVVRKQGRELNLGNPFLTSGTSTLMAWRSSAMGHAMPTFSASQEEHYNLLLIEQKKLYRRRRSVSKRFLSCRKSVAVEWSPSCIAVCYRLFHFQQQALFNIFIRRKKIS